MQGYTWTTRHGKENIPICHRSDGQGSGDAGRASVRNSQEQANQLTRGLKGYSAHLHGHVHIL